MKRCPQCEFIYEDEQSLCDMDGVLLVFDSRTLPNLHALATVSAPVPEKTARRNRMVPAFATLILMLAVASVYYVSTVRNSAPRNFAPPSVTGPSAEAPVVVPPAPSPAEVETIKEERNETHAPLAQPAAQPAPPSTQPAAPSPSRKAATRAATKPAPRKDDSKVESIIKKTGKLLKKPFKF